MTKIYTNTCTYTHILVLKETPADKVVLRHLQRVLQLHFAAQFVQLHCDTLQLHRVAHCNCIVLELQYNNDCNTIRYCSVLCLQHD